MTAIDRNVVLVGMTLVALAAIAAAFSGSSAGASGMIVLIILGELVVYFIALMTMNKKATIGMAASGAFALTVTRALCSLIGGMAYGVLSGNTGGNFTGAWMDLVPAVIQAVLLIIAGPYLLAVIMPDLIGIQSGELRGEKPKTAKTPGSLDTAPSGGFIQLFSFEELSSVIKKSHGIEGFIIYSQEGLVVWKDIPLRMDTDVLTAKMVSANAGMTALMSETGLTQVRRMMVESRDHLLFTATLNQNFGLILLFNIRSSPEENLTRIAMLAKTTREFLQWKYPSLPMAGYSRDRISLEAV